MLFSITIEPFYNPKSNAQGSNFSTSSPTIVTFCFFRVSILMDVRWYLIVDLIAFPE